ncbi:MAG: hypothetical protein A2Y38_08040 [Spirochaetes bacterium GWB1_59_5]|nr:MAG: hypothetical protein A2Y38_08040 [Spirochaetes bacterium GWB1_59_5]
MPSCILFHGPGALQAVLQEAQRLGRLVAPPFGEEGLKVDEARAFVSFMNSTPIGDGLGVVVAGPMDLALPRSSDVLLKSIEEFNAQVVYPLLWAHDEGGVMGTIRSRCLDWWCPGVVSSDEDMLKLARTLVTAALDNQPWKIPSLLASLKEKGPEQTDSTEVPKEAKDLKQGVKRLQLLGALAEALLPRLNEPGAQRLWRRLRGVAVWHNPTGPELVSALFPPEGDH